MAILCARRENVQVYLANPPIFLCNQNVRARTRGCKGGLTNSVGRIWLCVVVCVCLCSQ